MMRLYLINLSLRVGTALQLISIMENSLSCEANSRSPTEDIIRHFLNWNIYYRVHKSIHYSKSLLSNYEPTSRNILY